MADCFCTRCAFQHNTRMKGFDVAYTMLRKRMGKECHHNWRFVNGKAPAVCINCGVTKSSECEHDWYFYDKGASMMCKKCGLKK